MQEKDKQDCRDRALARYDLIAPLLEPDLEAAEKRRRRSEILARAGVTERTLRLWLEKYRNFGFDGLLVRPRSDQGKARSLPEDVLKEAIAIKEELPERSVSRVIEILEGEKKIVMGKVTRSTLTRHLAREGFSGRRRKKHLRGSRRFQKEHRNQLWQADVKYGPYLPSTSNPKKKFRTYLLAIIDDATRACCAARFYADQRLPILEDCFRRAVLRMAVPDAIYVDNGKIFISRWFRLACAHLGIRHLHTKPMAPESKGKVEVFNRNVESFLAEVALQNPKTVDDLNRLLSIWVEEGYNHHPHSALDGQTPAERFQQDERRIRFASPEECRQAFLWEESRRVDKAGCIKLSGTFYEVGINLIGKTVDIRFDPFDLSLVEVWRNGKMVGTAAPLVIKEFNDSQKDEVAETRPAPDGSRLLKVLEEKSRNRLKQRFGAISFRSLEGDDKGV
jgi:transposase InsO family protein